MFKKVIYDKNFGLNKGDVYVVLFETNSLYLVIKYKSYFTFNLFYNMPIWWVKKDFKTEEEWKNKLK